MSRNLSHIAAMAFNEPLLLEPAYARVFFCALGNEMGALSLGLPQEASLLSAPDMQRTVDAFMVNGKRPAKLYRVEQGIAVLPVSGTLVHKLGAMRPFSGMTGYDGITALLKQAVADPEVKGILLDIDSPGGQASGAFDCADMVARLGQEKPIWALCHDMACSAAMLLASACSRRLVTQTAKIGSIGVMMAHANREHQLAQTGVDITLIYSGSHKVDGNAFQALPERVRADFQRQIDEARTLFVQKVAGYLGVPESTIRETEAATYQGQAGIDVGLADDMVNAADAVDVMASAFMINQRKEDKMSETQLTAAQIAAQENQRVMGILTCPEAKGRESQAQVLASQPGVSVEQARAILAASGVVDTTASAVSESDKILACEEAKGREKLAQALAATPGMTAEYAKPILVAAAPEGDSVRDAILGCDEAKGREALAQVLAADPTLTVAKAKQFLAAAPQEKASSQEGLFDRFMAQQTSATVSAQTQVDNSNPLAEMP